MRDKRRRIRILLNPEPEGCLEVLVMDEAGEELCAVSWAELEEIVERGAALLASRKRRPRRASAASGDGRAGK